MFKFTQEIPLQIEYLLPKYPGNENYKDVTNYFTSACNVVEQGIYASYLINSDEELAKVILFLGLKKTLE